MQQLNGGILGHLTRVVKWSVRIAFSSQLSAVSLCAQDGRDPLACPPLCVLFARGRVREGASSLLISASSR